jgi:hypothetical protein
MKKQQEFYNSLAMPSDYRKSLQNVKIDKNYTKNKYVICCDVICEYCIGCVDLAPKENYSCFKGSKLTYVA